MYHYAARADTVDHHVRRRPRSLPRPDTVLGCGCVQRRGERMAKLQLEGGAGLRPRDLRDVHTREHQA